MHQSTGGDTYEAQAKEINSLIEKKVTQAYDGFNRLTKAVKVKAGDRTTVNYVYNGDGLRVKKTVSSAKAGNITKETNYVYDRQHVILEMDGSSKLNVRYIRGINYIARMNQAKAYSYYLFNGHGDVVQTVTSAGEVQNQYDYDVFGNPTLSIESYSESIRYAGEYYDGETGLYYLRARYYDPYNGRFLSEDSYWGKTITRSVSISTLMPIMIRFSISIRLVTKQRQALFKARSTETTLLRTASSICTWRSRRRLHRLQNKSRQHQRNLDRIRRSRLRRSQQIIIRQLHQPR
ncbi:RHS repeat-associated core domain-containing protein [Paenibacillus rhizoplanae]